MGPMESDHVAIIAADLDAGCRVLETRLGVRLHAGGQHQEYATHNRLLGLGPDTYLEVIAPRSFGCRHRPVRGWFGLDHPPQGPVVGNWIVRVLNLDAALADAPPASGRAVALSRGDLSWRIAVPDDGTLPLRGGWPSLLEWGQGCHPARRLPDDGVCLTQITVHHPQADWLRQRLSNVVTGVPLTSCAGRGTRDWRDAPEAGRPRPLVTLKCVPPTVFRLTDSTAQSSVRPMSIWTRIGDALSALSAGESLSVVFDKLRTRPERTVAFTIAVIALGAKMAKADGHVTRDEVSAFREVFVISKNDETQAARVFNLARQDSAGYEQYAQRIGAMFRQPDGENAALRPA